MDNQTPTSILSAETTPSAKPPRTSRLWITILVLMIIALIAATIWLGNSLLQLQNKNTAALNRLNVLTQRLERLHTTNKTQLDAMAQQTQQQQDQLTELKNQIVTLTQQGGAIEKWKVSEIVYLVRIANIALTTNHDTGQALLLLEQADDQLATLDDPALEAFHQALDKDIAMLEAVPSIDIPATIDQLSVLRGTVPDLSILVAPKPNTSLTVTTQHQVQKRWWRRAWDNIKASLQQLVIIRHQDHPIPALMAPEQQIYLQENLQLLLMQAQWALINHQDAVYHQSLQQAKTWAERFYVQNSASTQDFLKQLQQLNNINLAPPLPDLNKTLALLAHDAE